MKKKSIKKIFLYSLLFFILILSFFLYIGQPDHGGSKECYRLTGIYVDHYKGTFVPEFFVPSFYPTARFKFKLEKSDFFVLKNDIESRYRCVWGKSPGGIFFPGMEIQKDGDIITSFERDNNNTIVWLCYNPEEEYLYIGWFSH